MYSSCWWQGCIQPSGNSSSLFCALGARGWWCCHTFAVSKKQGQENSTVPSLSVWQLDTQPRKKMHLVCRWQFGRNVTSILRFSFVCLIFLVVNREYHNLQGFCRCLSEFYVSKIQMFALTILLNILMLQTCLEIIHRAYFLSKAFEKSSYLQLLVCFC